MTKKSAFFAAEIRFARIQVGGIQRWHCRACGRQFLGGYRVDNQQL
jgi:transposase-like protein